VAGQQRCGAESGTPAFCYDYVRLVDLPLKAGKRERVQGHTLQWWDEPVSKIRLFRVVDGYPAPSLQRHQSAAGRASVAGSGQLF
jgi:hypothetical protein